MSWILIVVAVVGAVLDWFTSKPKPDEPKWPRWAKLACAAVVAAIGVAGLLEGHFAKQAGLAALKDRKFLLAVEKLSTAYASPFKDRQVIDHLGLAHKGIADQAVDGPVASASYKAALDYFLESRAAYPDSPYAKNAMINIYRKTGKWAELAPLARSFESELKSDRLRDDGKPLSDSLKASFLVTLGNILADADNTERSDIQAVALYRSANALNPGNSFFVLNMPPRLIDLARQHGPDSKDRYKLLEEALALSVKGLDLPAARDKVFSVLSVIQVMMMDNAPPVPIANFTLADALKLVEDNLGARKEFDIDSWFILTEAHLVTKQAGKAESSFNQALIHQGRFSKAQHEWAGSLWKHVVKTGDYPFRQRDGSR